MFESTVHKMGRYGKLPSDVNAEDTAMPIAEEIYAEVQTLPDELAREVLDFVHFIEARYRYDAKAPSEQGVKLRKKRTRVPGSAVGKLKVLVEDDEHLNDFQGYMP